MAEENDDGQEKTEEPSQRKIDKSREDGKVLTSKEMFIFTSIFTAMVLMFFSTMIFQTILEKWLSLFYFDYPRDLNKQIIEKFSDIIKLMIYPIIFIGVPLMIITLITQAVVGGFNFALKAALPKANKMNPLKGLKRMFGMKGLVELAKSLLKLILLFSVGFIIFYLKLPNLIELSSRNIGTALSYSVSVFPEMLGALSVVLAIIAMIDYLYQKFEHNKSLKMTKQEVKEEMKQTEGSPEVKAKIRRMQLETSSNASKQQSALKDVPDATAVITNPTHFAVALKYDIGSKDAPKVLAMGRGGVAQEIIGIAKKSNVSTFSSPLLARALFFTSEIGSEISEKLYQSVAIVLAYLYKIDNGEIHDEPNVDIPDELIFNEMGQKVKKDDK